MDPIMDWGVTVILWFQQFSPTLDLPFIAFTLLGEERFFMLLLPFLYWCVDRRAGMRLAVLFLSSAYLNAAVKTLAGQPRPFDFDPRVRALYPAGGAGFPSGHTQSAVVVWGYLASSFRRPWLWVAAALLLIFVPLSRIYLGVHFPTDLLGGYVLGIVLLLLYLRVEPLVEGWLKMKGLFAQGAAAVALPGLLLLLAPTDHRHGITTASALMGMSLGFALEKRWVRFDSGGTLRKRALRFLAGMALLMPLAWVLETVSSGVEPSNLLRFLRYVLLGLATTAGMPWLFLRLRLADHRHLDS